MRYIGGMSSPQSNIRAAWRVVKPPLKYYGISILIAVIMLVPGSAAAQGGDHLWSMSFGAGSDQQVAAIATDPTGSLILVGSFFGSIDFGGGALTSAGSSDVFVAKFDPYGMHEWSQGFGDAAEQTASAVAVDSSGNIVVVGQFQGVLDFGGGPMSSSGGNDVFLAKLNPAGGLMIDQRYGDASEQTVSGVAVDGNDNIVLTGQFEGVINLGGGNMGSAGSTDIFFTKLTAAGIHTWSKSFGDAAAQTASAVVADGNDNIVLTGQFEGVINLGGGNMVSAGSGDVFLASFTSGGAYRWTITVGDENAQAAAGLTVDRDGNIFLAGNFQGEVDFGSGPLNSSGGLDVFVANIDANGYHQWSSSFGDSDTQEVQAISTDSTGALLLAGGYQGAIDFGGGALTSAGSVDAFLARLTALGDHLWSQSFGDTLQQVATDAGADSSGRTFLTGDFTGAIDLGGGPLSSGGGLDVFVASFGLDGFLFADGFESGDPSEWNASGP